MHYQLIYSIIKSKKHKGVPVATEKGVDDKLREVVAKRGPISN